MRIRSLLLALTFSGLLGLRALSQAGSDELVANPQFLEALDVNKVTVAENHAAVSYVALTPDLLQGWKASSGRPLLGYWKGRNRHSISLREGAGICQTVPVVAGRDYTIGTEVYIDNEGPTETALVIKLGDHTERVTIVRDGLMHWSRIPVRATSNSALLTIQVAKGSLGLFKVSLRSYDPVVEKMQQTLAEPYARLDKARKRPRDADSVRELLTDDFSASGEGGCTYNASSYIEMMRLDAEKRAPSVRSEVESVHALPGGAEVKVARTFSFNGEYGKRVNDLVRFKEVWVGEGKKWKLKSSELLSEQP